eukprot:GHUV01024843.1.p2 GENE.GHUV01024843.1~~GHUV01024843.1.p2  ORF type:complete len:106 (-),score=14.81 GHUV01024843.1:96-413(-)
MCQCTQAQLLIVAISHILTRPAVHHMPLSVDVFLNLLHLTSLWAFLVAGHTCSMDHDGFYIVSYTMAAVGLVLGVYFSRLFPRLDRLPLARWRAKDGSKKCVVEA